MKKAIKLKRKTAERLAAREFGMTELKLHTERADGTVYIYKREVGRFEIIIENDWYEKNGLIHMEVSSGYGETMNLYFDPWTLKENIPAELESREEADKERCAACRFWAKEEPAEQAETAAK